MSLDTKEQQQQQQRQIPTTRHEESPTSARMISASVGSLLTSLVVTPLEVVKVRQQTGRGKMIASTTKTAASIPRLVPCANSACGCLVLVPQGSATATSTTSTFGLLRRILFAEGWAGIYAGIPATLIMGVPNTVLYYTAYDSLSSSAILPQGVWYAPAIAGSTARWLASTATAPLELIKTRQAAAGKTSLRQEFQSVVRHYGVRGLWQGLAPTLARDVPFSAIYWMSIESMNQYVWNTNDEHVHSTTKQVFGQALVNGSVAGMIAAACTTPLDVVKTRRQTSNPASSAVTCGDCTTDTPKSKSKSSISSTMRSIVRQEGVRGLWRGNVARMAKVAPACAIMLSTYQVGKELLTTYPSR